MAARQPSSSTQFKAILTRFAPSIVALAKRGLRKLRRAFPDTFQLVYDYRRSVVWSLSPSEHGVEGIVALAIFPRDIRLYFDRNVPDPARRLRGSGAKVRSVTLESAAELDAAEIRALIAAAVTLAGHAPQSTPRRPRMIFKATSAAAPKRKRKPKAPPPPRKRPAASAN